MSQDSAQAAAKAIPLITDPVSVFMYLLALIGFVFWLSELPGLKRFFHFFPPLVFCYFLPMASTTLGITPMANPLYGWFDKVFLLPILLLLLISADMKAILRLGPKAISIMVAASVGIMLGAVIGYALLRGQVDPEGWKNVGALAASWTGGSANMFAVKSALQIPDKVFSPMIIVDAVFYSLWLGIVISLSAWQEGYARRFKVDQKIVVEMNERVRDFEGRKQHSASTRELLMILAIALGGGYLCRLAGAAVHTRMEPLLETYPKLQGFSVTTLAVIFVTAVGIVLALTPVRKLEEAGASKIGYAMLYMLLPTYGAQANLREFWQIPSYSVIAIIMLVVLSIMIFAALRLWKAPLFFGAVASQANVGGAASAAIVASAYMPALVPVGVLLGILGGIMGTYCGLLTAYLCRIFAP